MVSVADMLWSPGLVDRRDPLATAVSEAYPPSSVAEATELYLKSAEPTRWEQRRLAAAYLLKELNPPLQHRTQWEALAGRLESAPPSPSAWDYWQRYATAAPARGFFGPYQNRLGGLRRAQLQASAERLRDALEKNDYVAYREGLSRLGDSSGPLWLALTLQPLSAVGREDLLPSGWWWAILLNQSQNQALHAGIRLARGKTPEMNHRWEGRTCVCWSPGVDGSDDAGKIEADPQALESVGDWIYRFR